MLEIFNFFRFFFFLLLKKFVQRSSVQFWQTSQNNCQKARKFSVILWKWIEKYNYFEWFFSSNCSSGYVDCSVDNPAENKRREFEIFTWLFRKRLWKVQKKFSRKCPYWHLEVRFVNPVWNIITKGRQFFAHCPQLMKKSLISKTSFGQTFTANT